VITNYDSVMALKAFEKKNLKIHKNKIAFQNEIDVMRMLSSRHIATVDGLFETEKNIYIKMEYFSFSLKHYIKKNISIKIQKRVMKQLLEALLEMKRKDIIHRDLKPENVMIRGKNENTMECVVIDFGLATPASLEKYIFNRCGTPGFLAPEIAKMSTKKDKLTPACDMFSLGCIFYRM
jgi:serine/threonine protein kinase